MRTRRDSVAGEGEPVGVVFNVQRCSLHDGPGVRTTVFLKGCPLRCPWCHNPEGIDPEPQVMVNATRCMACGSCTQVCRREGGPLEGGHHPGTDACLDCRRCVDACPTRAREVAGASWTVAEVLDEVLRDLAVYHESAGGVTFSGGEPMHQPAFLLACLAACRGAGLHTAVDTCGYAPREVTLAVAAAADLLLWDVKTLDPARHLELTGAPLEQVLENLGAIAAVGTPIWLRLPLLGGINDDDASIGAAVALAARTPSVRRVSLLPFHRTGTGKLASLGRSEALESMTPPAGALEAFARRFAAAGIAVNIGG